MRTTAFLVLYLCSSVAMALDQKEVNRLVSDGAGVESSAYVQARDRIVGLGTNALPFLGKAAVGEGMDWRVHLVARICYERIVRAEEIEALRKRNWKQYPPYAPGKQPKITIRSVVTTNDSGNVVTNRVTDYAPGRGITSILGPQADMGPYVIPKMKEAGLWYHYLEAYWKRTGEGALPSFDQGFDRAWGWWGVSALEDEPEQYYRIRILIGRLGAPDVFSSREGRGYYLYLRDKKIPGALPTLVDGHQALFDTEVTGSELFPGRHAEIHRHRFGILMSFADASHADLIEKYIDEHPALAPLREKVAEIRARPAQPPTPEPPFRLGLKLVELK